MLKDLASLYELYSRYLFSSSTTNTHTSNYEYIRSFAAESFAYLLRKIENYQSFVDYLFDRRERDADELESLALVFSETCRNVQSTFHSCTKALLTSLWQKFLRKPDRVGACMTTIYASLVEHTNKQHADILWTCLMNVYRSMDHQSVRLDQDNSMLVYRTFYQVVQMLIDRKMVTDTDLCLEFLSTLTSMDNPDSLKLHYETVWKLMKQVAVAKDILDVYYQFAEQTPTALLYQETRNIFQTDVTEKLPNEFYARLWSNVLKRSASTRETIDCFVDAITIERKKMDAILLAGDTDQQTRDRVDLLKGRKKLLTKDRVGEQGLELIRSFIQETFAKIDDTQTVVSSTVVHNASPFSL